MTSVAILIFFIIFIIFVSASHNSRKQKKMQPKRAPRIHISKCKHTEDPHHVHSDLHVDAPVMGLNELEQDTQTRGYVPYANQPDHVGNLWKSDQSQINESCHGPSQIHSYQADIQTPMREKVVNLGVNGVSDMHIMSRFGCISS